MANAASAPKQKISPVIIVVAVAGLAGAGYLLTPQDSAAPVKKPAVTTTRTATNGAASADGVTAADTLARFEPYVSARRDAFMPLIVSSHGIAGGKNGLGGNRGTWVLTGISSDNGQLSALIENSLAGASQFLKTGDMWNGLQVINVSEDTVTFQNAKGQKTELMFPASDGKVAVKGDDAAAFGGEAPGETPPTPAPAGAAPVIILNQGAPASNPQPGDGGGGGFPGGGGGGFPGGGGGFPGGGGGFPGGGGGFPGGGGGFPGGGGGFPGQGTFNNSTQSSAPLASDSRQAGVRQGTVKQK